MNTLSNEFYRGFNIATVLVNGYHMPYYTEFTEPELSYIWLKPLKAKDAKSTFDKPFEPIMSMNTITGTQGTLSLN